MNACFRLFVLLALVSGSALAQSPPIPPRGNPYFDRVGLGIEAKIVGGVEAPAGSYPWQVSLQRADRGPTEGHFCGASIRTARFLVTAAHCVANLQPSDLAVVVGTQKLEATTPRLAVQAIVIHKYYNSVPHDYDVALVLLKQAVPFAPTAQPIPPLPLGDEPGLDKATMMVTGWGATQQGGPTVRTLREVAVPLVPRKTCTDKLFYGDKVTDRMICAGDAQNGGIDSCQGDSGGPLATARRGPNARLVGIVSWGEGCAKPGKPGIYARVPVLNDWIEACMANSTAC